MMLVASQQNHNLAFYAAPLYGLSKTFYWPGFHSLMARYSDRGQVGREFGLVYSLISLTLIAGPLLAGFLSQRFGFTIMFIVTAAIYSFSIFPLFRAKEIFLPKIYKFKDTLEIYKSFPNKFFGYLGFGEEVLVMNVWPVFIFLIVKNYEGAGSLATISSLIAAILALIVGKITDQYGKRVLIKIGAFFTAIIWLGRMIATNFWNTFFIDALSRTAKELAFIPISTVTYIRAENTHVVPYIIFFEQSLAIGKLLACLAGMIVFTIFSGLFGLGIGFVALFILGALFSLLYMLI
jgi:MFS family permease